MLPPKQAKGPYLTALEQARLAAKSDLERARLTMVLAYAYVAQERWADIVPLGQELMKAYPNSVRAFSIAVMAYTRLNDFDEWEKLVRARMQEHPDELAYTRSAFELAVYRKQFGKAREIIKALIDKGEATSSDMNSYAWFALLLPDPIDQDSLDVAQRANDLTKNNNFAILHTLACIDAQAGKTSQARELLVKAMNSVNLEEPNSEIWFGFGLIAERYGVLDGAATMYGRIEKPKFVYPGSSYAIAQQHLAALHSATGNSAKNSKP